jgi:hypothetical protein
VTATAIGVPESSTHCPSMTVPPSHSSRSLQTIANPVVSNIQTTMMPPPQYYRSNVDPRSNNHQPNIGASTATNAPVFGPNALQKTTKPPLTASENLQHVQSTMLSAQEDFATVNSCNQHLRHINNEGSVRKDDDHNRTTTIAANIAAPTKSVADVQNQSAVTASTIVRPRTSGGRNRKSQSPPAVNMANDVDKQACTVVVKKSKLNPYST